MLRDGADRAELFEVILDNIFVYCYQVIKLAARNLWLHSGEKLSKFCRRCVACCGSLADQSK